MVYMLLRTGQHVDGFSLLDAHETYRTVPSRIQHLLGTGTLNRQPDFLRFDEIATPATAPQKARTAQAPQTAERNTSDAETTAKNSSTVDKQLSSKETKHGLLAPG